MSAEGRPRRTARTTVRVPVQLATVDSNTKSRTGSTLDGVPAEQGSGVGKRKLQHSAEDGMDVNIQELGLEEQAQSSTREKRKTKSTLAEKRLYDIDFILTNPKSPLVNLDISDVLNYGAWSSLSSESRARLCKLLPTTTFGERYRKVDEFHPSRRREQAETFASQPASLKGDVVSMQVDGPSSPRSNQVEFTAVEERPLDPSFFRDPHFESAARTFQDHLYSGWFTPRHKELVEKHLSDVRDGSLHAPWKDDVWDRENPRDDITSTVEAENEVHDPSNSIGIRPQRQKWKESEFAPFIKKGFLKQGDIISLKHKFINQGITIEKDALVTAIHHKSGALTLTASSGSVPSLPASLLTPVLTDPSDPSSLREMTVSTPAQLITALIDIDGRIQRSERPRLDTWKILTVWQWTEEAEIQGISSEEAALLERGGRVCLGTLFYLRGQALDD